MDNNLNLGLRMRQNREIADQDRVIFDQDSTIARMTKEIADLKRQLALAQAADAGSAAQVEALLNENPGTALMEDSGVPWKSKNYNKTVVRVIYEQAYAAAAKARGIANPVATRQD